MRKAGDHIIRKASVNLRFHGSPDGIMLQQQVADWCRNALGPAIDSVLAEYSDYEELIAIDSLRLDLDLGNETDWQKSLEQQLIRAFKEKLHDKISVPGPNVEIKPAAGSFSDILSYYLKFGFLPWNSYLKNKYEFDEELKEWIGKTPLTELKMFFSSIPGEGAIKRISGLLSENQLITLISSFLGIESKMISFLFDDIYTIVNALVDDKSIHDRLLNDFKLILLEASLKGLPDTLTGTGISTWLNRMALNFKIKLIEINDKGINSQEIRAIIRSFSKDISGNITPAKLDEEIFKKDDRGADLQKELLEGVFIDNAGAVIIAPFLPMLFSRTGLVKEDTITDEARALSLLNYCITGNKIPVDFNLLLPKVLCGILPEATIDPIVLDDDTMIQEADDMLTSVIGHWSVLKETSIEGLREAFLQRNGKLVFFEDEWHLVAEQKPYDILLSSLPWNISMIRLPWMKNMLKTTWT